MITDFEMWRMSSAYYPVELLCNQCFSHQIKVSEQSGFKVEVFHVIGVLHTATIDLD